MVRPDPPHRLRLYPIMSFAVGSVQVLHKFECTFLDVNLRAAMTQPVYLGGGPLEPVGA